MVIRPENGFQLVATYAIETMGIRIRNFKSLSIIEEVLEEVSHAYGDDTLGKKNLLAIFIECYSDSTKEGNEATICEVQNYIRLFNTELGFEPMVMTLVSQKNSDLLTMCRDLDCVDTAFTMNSSLNSYSNGLRR